MKKLKILLPLIFTLVSFTANAELYPYARFFEFGMDAQALVTQNLIGVLDVFKETVVIDFEEISKSMGKDGLTIDAAADADAHINFDFKKFGIGFFFDLDAGISFSTGQGLIDFLAEGNPNGDVSSTLSMRGDLFASVSVPVKFKLWNIGVHVTPKLYLPVMYMPRSEADFYVSSDSSNMFYAAANADFSVYTSLNPSIFFDNSFDFMGVENLLTYLLDPMGLAQDFYKNSGFSLGLSAEIPIFRTLEAGAYINIPIVPGTMSYKANGNASFLAYAESLNSIINSSEDESGITMEKSFDFSGTESCNYKVREPLKFGVEAAWRPFGKWCTFRDVFGLAFRNPFGKDFNAKYSVYPEYKFSAEMAIFYVLHVNFSTEFMQQVYVQHFGLGINLRAIEIDADIYSASSSFAKSWSVTGLKAKVGILIGI